MEKDRLAQSIDYAEQVLAALREAVEWVVACTDRPERTKRIDAVAKRFEVTFEYVWKAFRSAARWKGDEAHSPRDAIQSAHQLGWITDLDLWAEFMEARNSGVYDYFGLGSEEYFTVATAFLPAAEAAVKKLATLV